MGRTLTACLVTLAAGTLTATALAGPAQAAPTGNATHRVAAADSRAAATYWTPERMASAKPLDAIQPAAVPTERVAPATTGKPATVAPVTGTAPAAPGIQPLAGAVARPYTDYPDRLTVKVFFSSASGNFVCSGTVVNSNNKDMIDTAGHCVSNGAGTWYSNHTVVPAYSSSFNGHRPYGTWTSRSLTTRTEWHSFSNFKQDTAYIILNTLGGQHIVNYLGGHGSAFNASRNQTWFSYGYPQAAPFNGFDQWVCVSGRLADDNPSPARPGPFTIRIQCDMTGGSSGGGWLISISGGLGYVNSHNSYRYSNNAGHMYGPYFGNEALSLYQYAQTI